MADVKWLARNGPAFRTAEKSTCTSFVVGIGFRGTTVIPAETEQHNFELPIDSSNRSE